MRKEDQRGRRDANPIRNEACDPFTLPCRASGRASQSRVRDVGL